MQSDMHQAMAPTAVQMLLEHEDVDPSAYFNDAVKGASQNSHFDFVKMLLQDARVDPSDDDYFATILASKGGHYDVVELLIASSRFKIHELSQQESKRNYKSCS